MVETVLLLAKIKHYTIVKLQYGAGSQTKTTMVGENYKHNFEKLQTQVKTKYFA